VSAGTGNESPAPRVNNRRRRTKQKQLDDVDENGDDDNALTGNPLGSNPLQKANPAAKIGGLAGVTGKKEEGGSEDGEKKDALKLRLDINLEVDIRITARVHGDVTLSLL